MKLTQALVLGLPAFSAAYPGMGSMSKAEMTEYLQKRQLQDTALEERQVLSGVVTGLIGTVQALTNTISGLLGAVANNISPGNKRPEPGYDYKAPGPSDSRGPCPGLNLLANHGYLPRNGHVTFQQVLEATSRGFNMGADLATILTTFAVLADGDIANESFYLGSLTGADGLNRHSTVEADVSPNREGNLFHFKATHPSTNIFQTTTTAAATTTTSPPASLSKTSGSPPPIPASNSPWT